MKTFILNTAGFLLVGLLLFSCSKEPSITDSDNIEFLSDAESEPFGSGECGPGPIKTKTLDLSGVVPSTLNGLSVSGFLAKIGWVPSSNLCTGSCVTGTCEPTSIEGTTSSDLQFETDNDSGLITGADWKNKSVKPKTATVKIKADSCDCL